jgi:hypothetical protein
MAKQKEEYDFEDYVIFMTFAHFGSKVKPDDLCCLNCDDAVKGYCPGEGREGLDVLGCMAGKVIRGERIETVQTSSN